MGGEGGALGVTLTLLSRFFFLLFFLTLFFPYFGCLTGAIYCRVTGEGMGGGGGWLNFLLLLISESSCDY